MRATSLAAASAEAFAAIAPATEIAAGFDCAISGEMKGVAGRGGGNVDFDVEAMGWGASSGVAESPSSLLAILSSNLLGKVPALFQMSSTLRTFS